MFSRFSRRCRLWSRRLQHCRVLQRSRVTDLFLFGKKQGSIFGIIVLQPGLGGLILPRILREDIWIERKHKNLNVCMHGTRFLLSALIAWLSLVWNQNSVLKTVQISSIVSLPSSVKTSPCSAGGWCVKTDEKQDIVFHNYFMPARACSTLQ